MHVLRVSWLIVAVDGGCSWPKESSEQAAKERREVLAAGLSACGSRFQISSTAVICPHRSC